MLYLLAIVKNIKQGNLCKRNHFIFILPFQNSVNVVDLDAHSSFTKCSTSCLSLL